MLPVQSPSSRRVVIWDEVRLGLIEVDHDAFVAFAVWLNRNLSDLRATHSLVRRPVASSAADRTHASGR